MKTTLYIAVMFACATSALARESPALSVSTNLVAPPEFRSYQLKKTYKRGDKTILEDIWHGRGRNDAKRMQHVFHDGKVVYTIREAGHGVIKHFKSNVVSIQEHDLNDDGKMDILFLMPLGSSEVIEAFSIAGGKFLSPLSSDDLFDKHGNKHTMSDVISIMKEKTSQQPDAEVQSEGAPSD
jgi:hypothetical protein